MACGIQRIARVLLACAIVSFTVLSFVKNQHAILINVNALSSSFNPAINSSATDIANGEETTHVLIARTASASEIDNVLEDILVINSYRENGAKLLNQSTAYCDTLHASVDPAPFVNESHLFPNQLLCFGPTNKNATTQENNYEMVQADFLIFAWDAGVIGKINNTVSDHSLDNVQIMDVTGNSVKVWNWLFHLSETTVYGYDYVWMVDGDIIMKSLHWHAFWQIIKLTKPKVAAPVITGLGGGI
mmetsp:Transcript_10645/g.22888  ORF Transcript_10645/g.22888 Transcript_10645/m.22888 type:complete len:245 (-) Transcript_10645:679-1413(-)